ncbi:MAG: glycosyltransferase family 4 protein [Anaerolineae bacterium]
MRVLMLSKACIVGIYQRKLEEIARLGVDLLTLVPPSWKDERGETPLERVYTAGYRLEVLPIRRNGDFHLHYYAGLGEQVRRFRPDIVHIDEEPYNLAAWQALFWAQRVGARALFFTWQNIRRQYPPPFSWGERWVLANVQHAIAGTDSAADVWRAKGYAAPISVIPQFGTDANLFGPAAKPVRPFTIGYFGRLVEEKGVHLLLEAVSKLDGDWQLYILGSGPQREALEAQAAALGIHERVTFKGWVASTDMPNQYHQLDALVLPSLTRANWKEQFGRVLVEALSSGVPVVGSDSGAIPDVIGDGGLIFPEGDVAALRQALCTLMSDQTQYAQLSHAARARVLAHFTHEQVAAETVRVYHSLMS